MLKSLLLLALSLLSSLPGSAAVIISATPNPSSLPVGGTVDVNVNITGLGGGTALGTYDITVSFNSAVLSYSGISWGNGLDVLGLGTIRTVTPSSGAVNLFELSLDSVIDLTSLQPASFLLATLHLNGVAAGSSPLVLSANAIGDALGNPISTTFQNGTVSVGDVPEPSAAITIGSGLLLLLLLRAWQKRFFFARVKRSAISVGLSLALTAAVLSAFTVPIHLRITRGQLATITETVGGKQVKFSDRAIEEILTANKETDDAPNYALNRPDLHFTNERFQDSQRGIFDAANEVVRLVTQQVPDGAQARARLGRALHTIQDFYAHSNWVELGRTSVLSQSLINPTASFQPCPGDPNVLSGGNGGSETSGYFIGGFSIFSPKSTGCKNLPNPGKCWHGNYFNECSGINKDYATRAEALASLPSIGSSVYSESDMAPPKSGHARAVSLAEQDTLDFINNFVLSKIRGNDKAVAALLDVRGTISFVIDDTGSMGEEISGVITTVNGLASQINADPSRKPDNWQLVRFGDPDIGPSRVTADVSQLQSWVSALRASGGGDCPELSQGALLLAINNALPGGQVFLFTDASAKDPSLQQTVVQKALEKNIVLNYALTGSCSPIDPAYFFGAQSTGGQAFVILPSEVSKLSDLFAPQLGGRVAVIGVSTVAMSSSPTTTLIPVENNVARLIVALSGSEGSTLGTVVLKNPAGVIVTGSEPGNKLTALSAGRIFTIGSPAVGQWKVEVQGTGDVTVLTEAESSLQFSRFDFVRRNEFDIHGGYPRIEGLPVAGESTIGEAVVFGVPGSPTFTLIDQAGRSLGLIPLAKNAGGADPEHFLGSFTLPVVPFRVVVTGQDALGAPFQRTFATLFRTQTVGVDVVGGVGGVVAAGQSTPIQFTLRNRGTSSATFSATASTSLGTVTGVAPSSLTLSPGGTGTVVATLAIPVGTPSKSNVDLTVTAVQQGAPSVYNSATTKLIVDVPALVCDLDGDRDVDQDDINLILGSLNLPAQVGNPADIDRDGKITALDARQCVTRCTNPRCEVIRK